MTGGALASARRPGERRLAWLFLAPALIAMAAAALFPLGWTAWESLHRHDLRAAATGMRFVGLANYSRALADPRLGAALGHTLGFAAVSVSLELGLGLVLALALDRAFRGRAAVRALALLPWSLPTVVSAMVWRFLFASETGPLALALARSGLVPAGLVWFSDPVWAWLPILAADVWKMTPFVTLLLLAGLQGIDPTLVDAAVTDGASPRQVLWTITLPLLRPAILVAALFRTLDALRVFDLIYVMTGGGPGTATEPIALLSFETLFRGLDFGYGSALSLLVFALSFVLALALIRLLGRELTGP